MPNHILNIVTITGDELELSRLKTALKISENEFDFNGVVPMPKELTTHSSPIRIISEEEYRNQELVKRQIKEKIDNGIEVDYFERDKLTSGGITKEIRKELLDKFGVDNWYNWAILNWGTKWGAYDVYIVNNSNNELIVQFNTAWSTPLSFLLKLSEQYPTLQLSVRYADEDFGHNVGEYKVICGHMTEENIPDGGSKEAFMMASQILGDDYYLYSIFFDYDSVSDFGDKDYVESLIEVSIESGKFDSNLPEWVLEHAKQFLLEREDYEMLSKIRDVLNEKTDN